MVEQPAGTVTLVFTDIEGSTRLLRELGEQAFREALAEHRRIVRAAFEGQRGYEVDYEGDAFFYAFPTAGEAVAAVEQAMDGLAATPIRLRVGIHTGNPGLDPPKYVGLDVHLAARIMSAGHGGQVLLSAATAALVEESMTELGEHRLKDFADPVPLFQLRDQRFPPLKTISNTNLPRPASSFIGREREVKEVVALLRDGARLLTLEGPGGSGKTRLAIEAAGELVGDFKGGVFWVGLAGLRQSSLVLPTIAQTLGAREDLTGYIEERQMLLLLDNFEQVIDAAPELSELVEACRNLTVLVTSRELLRVRGEVRYKVLPLADSDAVTLFCSRAQVGEEPTVAELCNRLDNLPLAVELAAARANALSPAQMLERVGERLDLFQGGRDVEQRQRTLRATIEWSYDLLTQDEQRLFRSLAVFAGGCTLDAAEQAAAAKLDILQSLVEKSLVRNSNDRFWMLETIREFGLEQLDSIRSGAEAREQYADYYVAWAANAGKRGQATIDGAATVFHEIDRELANIRSAMHWRRVGGEQRRLLEVVEVLDDYVANRPGTTDLLSVAEEVDLDGVTDNERVAWLRVLALFGQLTNRFAEADAAFQSLLEAGRARADQRLVRQALVGLGIQAVVRGDLEAAERHFREANPLLEADGLCLRNNLSAVLVEQGRHDEAAAELAFQIAFYEERSAHFGVAIARACLAEVEIGRGNTKEAASHLRDALPELASRGGTHLGATGRVAAELAWEAADPALAALLLGAYHASVPDGHLSEGDRAECARLATVIKAQTGESEYQILEGRGREMSSAEIGQRISEAVGRTLSVETTR
jgi:predicted ATPase